MASEIVKLGEAGEAMNRFKLEFAKLGWVLVHETSKSEFDQSAPMAPEAYGWKKAPNGKYYLLQCPICTLSPQGHSDSSPAHKQQAIAEAMKRI